MSEKRTSKRRRSEQVQSKKVHPEALVLPQDVSNDALTRPPFNADVFLKQAPEVPGVYCMQGEKGHILYVGKAKNLKKRLASYFRDSVSALKTKALVKKIVAVDVTVTANEVEALLLEQSWIKKYKPPYNILLRDDKSYPYIHLSSHAYPRLSLHRGARKQAGQTFGPYPSAGAARESLKVLQKLFKVRQCEDSYFSNRIRPCLQYQINRCKAPCVGYVEEKDYSEDVHLSMQFLQGKSQDVIRELVDKMDQSVVEMDYEQAALYRDQIKGLQQVQASQVVDIEGGDVDVVGLAVKSGVNCIEVLFIRRGALLGHRHFFTASYLGESSKDILSAFMSQFYISHSDKRDYPQEILLSEMVDDKASLGSLISERSGNQVQITASTRGERKRWKMLAERNAEQALSRHLADKNTLLQRFQSLQSALSLSTLPSRLECFDISHTQGEGTVASCVVFNQEGAVSSDYRRFNIKGITPGDDYAALKQAVERRYRKLSENGCDADHQSLWPDVIFIDGGKGQVNAVIEVMESLKISLPVYGVTKGEGRKPGLDTIINANSHEKFHFDKSHPGLLLVQQIRDEAHRFALTGHRARRMKSRTTSSLEGIAGVGPKRRSALIKFFGGLQGVKQADVLDLMKVQGISRQLAEDIYHMLHG